GIEADGIGTQEMNQTSDAKHCVRCGAPYDYAVYYYAHLGRYACPSCGHKRPKPEVYVDRIWDADAKGTSFHLVTPAGSFESRLQIPGLYNLYNALAAAAGAHLMGCSLESIKQGLSETTSQFGRMELIPMDGREVFMALVKNPVGFNSVLETVMGPGGNLRGPCEFSPGGGCRPEGSGKKVVIAINDLYADGTDVSWLWDVDFESMAAQQERIDWVICAGIRAEDMAVRLKYAGFDTAKLTTLGDLEGALAQGMQRTPQGEMLYILPTYTAMLGMREIIQKQGHTKKFWEV
ncbi:MAG TPA: MurT ligase domain-containing protein, partial [Symbiobacteriaceae bacterium]|nr:MurT ligase domain-containing protein [Symbiobacteriaceae bacterium]